MLRVTLNANIFLEQICSMSSHRSSYHVRNDKGCMLSARPRRSLFQTARREYSRSVTTRHPHRDGFMQRSASPAMHSRKQLEVSTGAKVTSGRLGLPLASLAPSIKQQTANRKRLPKPGTRYGVVGVRAIGCIFPRCRRFQPSLYEIVDQPFSGQNPCPTKIPKALLITFSSQLICCAHPVR